MAIQEILGAACCAFGAYTKERCEQPYTRWCRGCNLVFCDAHLDREKHYCRNFDVRTPAPVSEPEKRRKRVNKTPPGEQEGNLP
jgi:hypothetical protein